ncbi:MAG: DUF302 domain-containing protein [Micromonosporaceae bacterium]
MMTEHGHPDQTGIVTKLSPWPVADTTLVIFGNPAAGTPVMAASPLAALDLPLKVLVWADAGLQSRRDGQR